MTENNIEHLIKECMQIVDDSLYTAEAHYILASKANQISFWVKLIPALAAAVSGIAVLSGAPNWVAWFSVISGVAFALQSILSPDKKKEEHTSAAKCYTSLKHEANALHSTFSKEMSREEFSVMVRILRDRYNMVAKLTPQTTIKAFEEGRKRIKAGIHIPDFEEQESESE